MPLSVNTSLDGTAVTIGIDGRFDFQLHGEFRRAYSDRDPRPRTFVVDLSRTSYLDSSALGMLLILRDHAGAEADVTLANPGPAVREILKLSNFDQLFKIS